MKKMMMLIVTSLMLTGLVAHAEPQKLDQRTLELLTVVSANARDFAELSTYGNKMVSATVEQTSGEFTRFTFTVQHCQLRGCLGGAALVVDRMRDLRPGLFPPYVYRTELRKFR